MRQPLLWTSCNSCDHEGVSLSMHLPKAFASYKRDKRRDHCHGRIGTRPTHRQQAGTAALAASTRINLSRPVFSNKPCISMRDAYDFVILVSVNVFPHNSCILESPLQHLLLSSNTLGRPQSKLILATFRVAPSSFSTTGAWRIDAPFAMKFSVIVIRLCLLPGFLHSLQDACVNLGYCGVIVVLFHLIICFLFQLI